MDGVHLLVPPFQRVMTTSGRYLQHRQVFSEGVRGLGGAEHQLGVQEALDESDVSLLTKVGGELATHDIAQQLGGYLVGGGRV